MRTCKRCGGRLMVETDRDVSINERYYACINCGAREYPPQARLALPKLRRRQPSHAGRVL